jgi:hypothetical protein
MPVSLYLLRAKDLEKDCGGSDYHKERIAGNCKCCFQTSWWQLGN